MLRPFGPEDPSRPPLLRPNLTSLLHTSHNQMLTQGLAPARPKLGRHSFLTNSYYANCSRGSRGVPLGRPGKPKPLPKAVQLLLLTRDTCEQGVCGKGEALGNIGYRASLDMGDEFLYLKLGSEVNCLNANTLAHPSELHRLCGVMDRQFGPPAPDTKESTQIEPRPRGGGAYHLNY